MAMRSERCITDSRISAINLQPRSRGYLTIQSIDPKQPPLMQPNYFYEERDFDVLVDAARIAYKLANTTVRVKTDYKENA